MSKDEEILCFECMDCGKVLQQGGCTEHRIETGHKEFEQIFGVDAG